MRRWLWSFWKSAGGATPRAVSTAVLHQFIKWWTKTAGVISVFCGAAMIVRSNTRSALVRSTANQKYRSDIGATHFGQPVHQKKVCPHFKSNGILGFHINRPFFLCTEFV